MHEDPDEDDSRLGTLRQWPRAVEDSYRQARAIIGMDPVAKRTLLAKYGSYVRYILPEHREHILGTMGDIIDAPSFGGEPSPETIHIDGYGDITFPPTTREQHLEYMAEALQLLSAESERLRLDLRNCADAMDRKRLQEIIDQHRFQRWFLAHTLAPFVHEYAPLLDALGIDCETVITEARSYHSIRGEADKARQVAAPSPLLAPPQRPKAAAPTPARTPLSPPPERPAAALVRETPAPAPPAATGNRGEPSDRNNMTNGLPNFGSTGTQSLSTMLGASPSQSGGGQGGAGGQPSATPRPPSSINMGALSLPATRVRPPAADPAPPTGQPLEQGPTIGGVPAIIPQQPASGVPQPNGRTVLPGGSQTPPAPVPAQPAAAWPSAWGKPAAVATVAPVPTIPAPVPTIPVPAPTPPPPPPPPPTPQAPPDASRTATAKERSRCQTTVTMHGREIDAAKVTSSILCSPVTSTTPEYTIYSTWADSKAALATVRLRVQEDGWTILREPPLSPEDEHPLGELARVLEQRRLETAAELCRRKNVQEIQRIIREKHVSPPISGSDVVIALGEIAADAKTLGIPLRDPAPEPPRPQPQQTWPTPEPAPSVTESVTNAWRHRSDGQAAPDGAFQNSSVAADNAPPPDAAHQRGPARRPPVADNHLDESEPEGDRAHRRAEERRPSRHASPQPQPPRDSRQAKAHRPGELTSGQRAPARVSTPVHEEETSGWLSRVLAGIPRYAARLSWWRRRKQEAPSVQLASATSRPPASPASPGATSLSARERAALDTADSERSQKIALLADEAILEKEFERSKGRGAKKGEPIHPGNVHRKRNPTKMVKGVIFFITALIVAGTAIAAIVAHWDDITAKYAEVANSIATTIHRPSMPYRDSSQPRSQDQRAVSPPPSNEQIKASTLPIHYDRDIQMYMNAKDVFGTSGTLITTLPRNSTIYTYRDLVDGARLAIRFYVDHDQEYFIVGYVNPKVPFLIGSGRE